MELKRCMIMGIIVCVIIGSISGCGVKESDCGLFKRLWSERTSVGAWTYRSCSHFSRQM